MPPEGRPRASQLGADSQFRIRTSATSAVGRQQHRRSAPPGPDSTASQVVAHNEHANASQYAPLQACTTNRRESRRARLTADAVLARRDVRVTASQLVLQPLRWWACRGRRKGSRDAYQTSGHRSLALADRYALRARGSTAAERGADGPCPGWRLAPPMPAWPTMQTSCHAAVRTLARHLCRRPLDLNMGGRIIGSG